MNDMQLFSFEGQDIKVIVDKNTNEILFDASNVCDILGYARNTGNVLEKLDLDEKRLVIKEEQKGVSNGVTPLGGFQDKYFVTEAGLYKLIFDSTKPEAKEFTRYVTHDLLPTVRKTGFYLSVPQDFANNPLILDAQRYMEICVEQVKQQAKQREIEQKQMEMLQQQVAMLIEQRRLGDALQHLQEQTAIETHQYCVVAYANNINVKVNNEDARKLGGKAAKISKLLEYPTGKVSHSAYGKVGTYHIDILKQVFDAFLAGKDAPGVVAEQSKQGDLFGQ